MEITWQGVLLFPLGLFLFIAAPRYLYAITVFSIPFTTTSLLNTASGVPVTPMIYFGSYFVARQIIAFVLGWCTGVRIRGDKSSILMFMFLGAVVMSMIMPLIIDGNFSVSSNKINDLYSQPVQLTKNNIKNPFPVIFFVLLSSFWIYKNSTVEKILFTIKIYVISAVFVSFWGFLQFFCNNIFSMDYPYYIFNNAVLDSMKGYTQSEMINGMELYRISSVTHEPSILSKYLLTVVPILFVSVLMKYPLFGRIRDKFIFFTLIVALIITTSSIAYIGMAAILIVTLVVLRPLYLVRRRLWVLPAILCIVVFLSYLWIPIFHELITTTIFLKLATGSALERSLSIVNSWEYFLEYPVLGLGWGMVTCHDLLVLLLVNSGVVGLVTFVSILVYVVRRSMRSINSCTCKCLGQHKDMLVVVTGLTISLITLIITGILTGLEFYLGYFYFVLSMLIASNTLVERETSSFITTARPIPVQKDC